MQAETAITIISTVVSTGAVGYIFKSAVRLEVLERLFAEKKQTIQDVANIQSAMSTRLALVEQAIIGLNELLPELRKFGSLGDKLELLLKLHEERLNKFEDAQ
jgi:uncharacterized coiled-coil protein SlyX